MEKRPGTGSARALAVALVHGERVTLARSDERLEEGDVLLALVDDEELVDKLHGALE